MRIWALSRAVLLVGGLGAAAALCHADTSATQPEASPAAVKAPSSSSIDIPLRSRDGHEFKAAYYAPTTSESGPGLLLIPHLGYDRKTLSGLSTLLVARGYRVLTMDNSGQTRNMSRGPRGVPTFAPLDRKIFDRMLLDLPPAVEALKRQPGVAPQVCVIGFGIGANLALQHAGTTPEIGALALIMPGFGCEEFDTAEALSLYGKRPLVLIESKKRLESDLARAFKLITRVRNDGTMERIVLPREPVHVLADLSSGQEGTGPLLEWLGRVVPASPR